MKMPGPQRNWAVKKYGRAIQNVPQDEVFREQWLSLENNEMTRLLKFTIITSSQAIKLQHWDTSYSVREIRYEKYGTNYTVRVIRYGLYGTSNTVRVIRYELYGTS